MIIQHVVVTLDLLSRLRLKWHAQYSILHADILSVEAKRVVSQEWMMSQNVGAEPEVSDEAELKWWARTWVVNQNMSNTCASIHQHQTSNT